MTNSIDKKLEALDVLIKILSQININYKEIDDYHGSYTLKLEDPYEDDEPYAFYITSDELDILKEVLDNIKPSKE